jgi:hypothetical protein
MLRGLAEQGVFPVMRNQFGAGQASDAVASFFLNGAATVHNGPLPLPPPLSCGAGKNTFRTRVWPVVAGYDLMSPAFPWCGVIAPKKPRVFCRSWGRDDDSGCGWPGAGTGPRFVN